MKSRLRAISQSATYRRFLPLLLAAYIVVMFCVIAQRVTKPERPDLHYQDVPQGALTEAQTQTLNMIKELNAYLISMTTLLFGGLGWYLSQFRPTSSPLIRAVFFSTVGFLALAFWYAAMTYGQITSDLSKNELNVTPGSSWILSYLELEFAACAVAGVLMLLVFADAVTRGKS